MTGWASRRNRLSFLFIASAVVAIGTVFEGLASTLSVVGGVLIVFYGLMWPFFWVVSWKRREPHAWDLDPEYMPLISVLAPARNEESVVGGMVEQMLRQTYEHWELLVVANNCTDATADVARAVAQGDPRVRVLEYEFPDGMKADALNRALPKCRGEIVVEFDTDNGIKDEYMERIAAAFSDPKVQGVQTQILSSNAGEGLLAILQDIEYMVYSEIFNRGREALGLSSSIGGTGFAIRTPIIRKMGGWHRELVEDFDLFTRLVKAGHKVSYLPHCAVYDEKPVSWAALVKQRKRWVRGHLSLTLRHMGSNDFGILDQLYLYAPLFVPLMILMMLIGYGFLLLPGFIDGYAYFSPIVWVTGLSITWIATSLALVRAGRHRMLPWVPAYLLFFGFHWVIVFFAALWPVSWSSTKTVHGAGNKRGFLPWIGVDGWESLGMLLAVSLATILWIVPLYQGVTNLDLQDGRIFHYATRSYAAASAGAAPGISTIRVAGQVVDPSNIAIKDATVVVKQLGGAKWIAVSDQAGGFVLHDLPTGDYEISIEADGYMSASTNFTLQSIGYIEIRARLAIDAGGGVQAIPIAIPY